VVAGLPLAARNVACYALRIRALPSTDCN
jgi:hypothetical protein